METTFVCLVAYAVFLLTLEFALSTMWGLREFVTKLSQAQVRVGLAVIVACPAVVTVFWVAIRMAGREFSEYLALNWPTPRELARGLAVVAIALLIEFIWFGPGGTDPSADAYSFVRAPSGLLIYLIGTCIAAPISEEFTFRGFMFRGWSQSFLGPRGAIVLTSAAWALVHDHYDWQGRLWIFISGLVLGLLRWRSNSTWLTVMVHSAVNTFIFFNRGSYV